MEKKDIVKEYTNGEITVVWKPGICMHSTICFNGLPEVFDPKARPWIDMDGAKTEQIIEQVKKCPSGALSFYMNDPDEQGKQKRVEVENERIVEISPNGPLMVYGNITVKFPDGEKEQREHRVTAFCRCGGSQNKPYCDGSHRKNGFKG